MIEKGMPLPSPPVKRRQDVSDKMPTFVRQLHKRCHMSACVCVFAASQLCPCEGDSYTRPARPCWRRTLGRPVSHSCPQRGSWLDQVQAPEQRVHGLPGAWEGWCNCSLPGTRGPLTHSDPLLVNPNVRYTDRAKLKGPLAGLLPREPIYPKGTKTLLE